MRVRLRELLAARDLTPYALAKASGGRLTEPRVYRLFRANGRFTSITADALEALCEVLESEPGELLERSLSQQGKSRRKGGGAKR